jgi:hypothetical protein
MEVDPTARATAVYACTVRAQRSSFLRREPSDKRALFARRAATRMSASA